MEKSNLDAKKLELLSDEELLNVCGGLSALKVNLNDTFTPNQSLSEARKTLCTRAGTNKEQCLQYSEYCSWDINRCKFKGDL